MSDIDESRADSVAAQPQPERASAKSKPTKTLPTDRVSHDSQLGVLRAYAKASEDAGRGAVSNNDVAKYSSIAGSSISLCNQFFVDIGLLIREGLKQRPADVVFAYDQACDWGGERPAAKLAPLIASSWFGRSLLAKLSLKSMTLSESLAFLAEECRAAPEYKPNVQLLLDYLEAVGLIAIDANTVSKVRPNGNGADDPPPPPPPPPQPGSGADQLAHAAMKQPVGSKKFSIPIPDKDDAIIILPETMDSEDWEMVLDYIQRYVNRWKQFDSKKAKPASAATSTNGEADA